jgi:hypothetical protein
MLGLFPTELAYSAHSNLRPATRPPGWRAQMMLMDNLIHSDLHPGNILVRLTPPGGLLGTLYNVVDAIKHSALVSGRVAGWLWSVFSVS